MAKHDQSVKVVTLEEFHDFSLLIASSRTNIDTICLVFYFMLLEYYWKITIQY